MQILFGEIVLLGRLYVNFGVEWGQRDDGFLNRVLGVYVTTKLSRTAESRAKPLLLTVGEVEDNGKWGADNSSPY